MTELQRQITLPEKLPEVKEAKEALHVMVKNMIRFWEAAKEGYQATGEDYIRSNSNKDIAPFIMGQQKLPKSEHPSVALIGNLRDLRSETQAFIEYFTRLALGGSSQQLDAQILKYVALVAHYARGQLMEMVGRLGSLGRMGDLLLMSDRDLVGRIDYRLGTASAAVDNMATELTSELESTDSAFKRLKAQLDTLGEQTPVVRVALGMGRFTGTLRHCPALTSEILREIILNASKPQVGATQVGFIVSEENGFLLIESENDGIPVPPDKTETIFLKGESTSGGGFGLYFLRDLIEKSYGGTISCTSKAYEPASAEAASKGTTSFKIRLPLHVFSITEPAVVEKRNTLPLGLDISGAADLFNGDLKRVMQHRDASEHTNTDEP